MGKFGKNSPRLEEIAKAAATISPISGEYAFELLLEGMKKMPEQLQMMINTVVAMQGLFPMPRAGWEQFVKTVERTNKRLGFNLRIGPIPKSDALKKYAASINKTPDELDENERKQAMLDAVLAHIDPSKET